MGHSIIACLPACLSDFMPASLIVSACLAVPSAARVAEPVAVDPHSTRWVNTPLGAAEDGVDRPRRTESSASSAGADRTESVVRPDDGARHLVVTRPLVLAGRLELDSLEVRPGGKILAFGDLAFFCLGDVRVHDGGEIVGARGAIRGGHVVLHSNSRIVIEGTVQGGHGGTYGAHGGSVVLRAPETLISGLVIGGDGLPGWPSLDGPGGDGGDGGHALCFGPAFDTTEHGTAELAGGAGGQGARGGVFATGAGAPGGRGGRGGSGGQVDELRDAHRPYVAECLAIEGAALVLPGLGAERAAGWLGARLRGVPELRGLLAWCFVPDCTANKGAQGNPHPGDAGTNETGNNGNNGGGSANPRAAACANGIEGHNGTNGSGGPGGGGGHGGAPTANPGAGGDGGDAGTGGSGHAGHGGNGQSGGHCCMEPPGAHGGDGRKGGNAGGAYGGEGGTGGDGANGTGGCKGGDAGRGGNGGAGVGGNGGTGGDGGDGLYPGGGGGQGLTQIVNPRGGGDPGHPGNENTPQVGKTNGKGDPGPTSQGVHGGLGKKGGPCPDLPGGGG